MNSIFVVIVVAFIYSIQLIAHGSFLTSEKKIEINKVSKSFEIL